MVGPSDPELKSAELEVLLERVAKWAKQRGDIRSVALVGSYARGDPTAASDVDLIVLTNSPDRYVDRSDWLEDLHLGELLRTRSWGSLTERRLRSSTGLEIDVGIAQPSWARVDPVDPGTRTVVAGGMRIVYDPDQLLEKLIGSIDVE